MIKSLVGQSKAPAGIVLRGARELVALRKAGRIVARVHEAMRRAVRPGMSTAELNAIAEDVIRSHGAVPTFLGRSSSWLVATNVKASLPFTNLIRLYAGLTLYPGSSQVNTLYEGGACLNIIPKTFEVYFPLFWAKEIQDVLELNNFASYRYKIRFVLNINNLNPMNTCIFAFIDFIRK